MKIQSAYDVPLIRTNTLTAVKRWIGELRAKDLFWHMDDDARDVPAFDKPVIALTLEAQRLLAHNICDENDTDIWDLARIICDIDSFIKSRVWESGPTIDELGFHHSHDCMTQLLIYGPGTDRIIDLPDAEIKLLEYLEWVPPSEGRSVRMTDSYDNPDLMRYTGYWLARKYQRAFRPHKLREAEELLWEKYRVRSYY